MAYLPFFSRATLLRLLHFAQLVVPRWSVHRACVALSGLCLFFCLPCRVSSQAGSHSSASLSGVLFSEGGNQRIGNAVVRLGSEDQSSWRESVTNDSGEFTFQGLPPGHFILQIRASGFDSLDRTVDLSFAPEHGLAIFLKATKNPDGQPSSAPSVSVHELSMPEAARELLASGKRKFYFEKNPQGGLRDFQSAVAKAPGYYEAYHQIGLAYLSLNDLAGAEKSLRKSVELSHGEFPDADIALGSVLADHGDAADGEALLRRGLELFPRSWIGHYELATIEYARGDLPTARQSAQQAKSLAPKQPLPHRLLAIIDLKEKNYPALLEELDAFIALEPGSPAGIRAKELRAQTQKTLEATAQPPQ
jgi:Flp pilus assembly protein TadD